MLIRWIMAPGWRGPCSWLSCSLTLILMAAVFQGVHTQMVLVNDTVSGFVGTNVILHCSFVNPMPNVKITQVTWQKSTNGSKQNVAIFNPSMGVSILPPYKERVVFQSPSIRDGTIQMNQLQLGDEGPYICEFATFPTGNRESQLNLTVLARPVNQMDMASKTLVANPLSNSKIVVATCMSANGKPPSTITWETKLKGEAEYQEIKNDNGTVTVISRFKLVPTREAHKQPLTCVINYQTERDTKNTTISVQYAPQVSIEGFDGNWYVKRADVKLMCKADSNPPPSSYRWKMANGSLPDSAEVDNNTLFFRGPVTYSFSGTYICEARNAIGSQTGQVDVNVTERPRLPRLPWVLPLFQLAGFPPQLPVGVIIGLSMGPCHHISNTFNLSKPYTRLLLTNGVKATKRVELLVAVYSSTYQDFSNDYIIYPLGFSEAIGPTGNTI
ncbi:nectin-1 isoform X4 [Lithobates pipiens]